MHNDSCLARKYDKTGVLWVVGGLWSVSHVPRVSCWGFRGYGKRCEDVEKYVALYVMSAVCV